MAYTAKLPDLNLFQTTLFQQLNELRKNKSNLASPSIAYLARVNQVSRQHITKSLAVLRALGYIKQAFRGVGGIVHYAVSITRKFLNNSELLPMKMFAKQKLFAPSDRNESKKVLKEGSNEIKHLADNKLLGVATKVATYIDNYKLSINIDGVSHTPASGGCEDPPTVQKSASTNLETAFQEEWITGMNELQRKMYARGLKTEAECETMSSEDLEQYCSRTRDALAKEIQRYRQKLSSAGLMTWEKEADERGFSDERKIYILRKAIDLNKPLSQLKDAL
jgi:hypothetical protein